MLLFLQWCFLLTLFTYANFLWLQILLQSTANTSDHWAIQSVSNSQFSDKHFNRKTKNTVLIIQYMYITGKQFLDSSSSKKHTTKQTTNNNNLYLHLFYYERYILNWIHDGFMKFKTQITPHILKYIIRMNVHGGLSSISTLVPWTTNFYLWAFTRKTHFWHTTLSAGQPWSC